MWLSCRITIFHFIIILNNICSIDKQYILFSFWLVKFSESGITIIFKFIFLFTKKKRCKNMVLDWNSVRNKVLLTLKRGKTCRHGKMIVIMDICQLSWMKKTLVCIRYSNRAICIHREHSASTCVQQQMSQVYLCNALFHSLTLCKKARISHFILCQNYMYLYSWTCQIIIWTG